MLIKSDYFPEKPRTIEAQNNLSRRAGRTRIFDDCLCCAREPAERQVNKYKLNS